MDPAKPDVSTKPHSKPDVKKMNANETVNKPIKKIQEFKYILKNLS